MKRLGFLTGAVLAGIGVFLFNQWRHVSDDDRLIAVLADHCIPYVQTGETPFQNLGRAPGVYDAAGPDNTLTDGGARLIFDLRFIAHWGVSTDDQASRRVCKVLPTYGDATVPFFSTNTNDLTARLPRHIPMLGSLTAENNQLGGDVVTYGWRAAAGDDTDLQVVLLAGPAQVSNVVVTAIVDAQ